MATDTTRWTRRRWIAEQFSSNLSDFDAYQPTQAGREGRLPIYTDGTLFVCVLPNDPAKKIAATLEGRHWKVRKHWRDPAVTIYEETDAAGSSPNFDFGR